MKPAVYTLDQIKVALTELNPIQAMEEGFVAYSEGQVIVPPVGELLFNEPPGETHIKYGYIKNADYYVIKVATGFYQNLDLGLSPTNGLMLLFRQKTGEPEAILLDEGHLTNVRTAAAGAVVAKYFAPEHIDCIGVFGAGIQARMQAQYLSSLNPCRKIMVWGVNEEECVRYQSDMEKEGYEVLIAKEPGDIGSSCNYIIMATPAKVPLLNAARIRPGTHITAMGSDTPEKQELHEDVLANADIIVGDSLEQCKTRGEIFRANSAGAINESRAVELGDVISGKTAGRTLQDQLTVADLTGVAIQDIQISVATLEVLKKRFGNQS